MEKGMKLYHYVARPNNVLEKGLLSFAANPNADLNYYFNRTGGKTTHKEVVDWMESCFKGRSRGIRGFSEPLQWTVKSVKMIKSFVEEADKFSIDISALDRDGMLEGVYLSPAIKFTNPADIPHDVDEVLVKLNSIDEIDFSPIDWSVCNDELGLRFSVIPYYLLIIKGGIIPPRYLTLES